MPSVAPSAPLADAFLPDGTRLVHLHNYPRSAWLGLYVHHPIAVYDSGPHWTYENARVAFIARFGYDPDEDDDPADPVDYPKYDRGHIVATSDDRDPDIDVRFVDPETGSSLRYTSVFFWVDPRSPRSPRE